MSGPASPTSCPIKTVEDNIATKTREGQLRAECVNALLSAIYMHSVETSVFDFKNDDEV